MNIRHTLLFLLALAGCQSMPVGRAQRPQPQPRLSETLVLEANKQLPAAQVLAIEFMADGSVAFGTGAGLAIWRNGAIEEYQGPWLNPQLGAEQPGNSKLPHNDVSSLCIDNDDTLWIGTGRGLARLRNGTLEDVTDQLPAELSEGLGRRLGMRPDVTCLYRCRDGRILIGTRNAGLVMHDPAAGTYTLLHSAPEMNQWVTAADEDSAGNLYVAVFGLGVLHYDGDKVDVLPAEQFPVPAHQARSLCVDSRDRVWIGTHDGTGARMVDGVPGEVLNVERGLPDNSVWGLSEDEQGRLWASTSLGWGVWDGRSWSYPEITELRLGYLSTLSRHDDGNVWFAGWPGAVRNPEITWHREPPAARALAKAKRRIEAQYPHVKADRHTAMDRLGRAWISVADKVWRFDGHNWSGVQQINDVADHVSFVGSDAKGRVFVGTSGDGLFAFDGGEIIRYNNDPGHARCVIYDMAESADGLVYVGTQGGLYALRDDEWQLLDSGGQMMQVAVSADGEVWIGEANAGLMHYDQGVTRQVARPSPATGFDVEYLWTSADDGEVRMIGSKRVGSRTQRKLFACADGEVRLIGDADDALLESLRPQP